METKSVKSIAWLAGILEGEGYFGFSETTPVIKLKMTDEDTIKKVASLFKRPMYEEKVALGNKQAYRVSICGTPAVGWMFTIYSLMSQRRKAKIIEVVSQWKSAGSYSKSMFGCGHMKEKENILTKGRYIVCKICYYKSNARFRTAQRLKRIANAS